jgi:predicted alpha/beta superfamily hydrolase
VSVYLPPGYDLEPGQRFPVLYLHDGQNLFDAFTAFAGVPWGVDEITERAVRSGGVRPLIIVGVANTLDRLHEYGPQPGPDDQSRGYERFLVEEVKPFIDGTYRTLPGAANTGVGGSSMGGLISLHLCQWRPDVFGRCAAMSPSLWWEDAALLRAFGRETEWLRTCRVWLDMGGREGMTEVSRRGNIRRARALARMLRRTKADFHYYEDSNGGHDEAAWGWRFEPMLRFLYEPLDGVTRTP